MGARMGFDGKWAIHPAQIDIIHEAYTPKPEEIAQAKRIIDAYEQADIQGGLGAIILDDQMVDAAILRVEWRKLAIAKKLALREQENPNDVQKWRGARPCAPPFLHIIGILLLSV